MNRLNKWMIIALIMTHITPIQRPEIHAIVNIVIKIAIQIISAIRGLMIVFILKWINVKIYLHAFISNPYRFTGNGFDFFFEG